MADGARGSRSRRRLVVGLGNTLAGDDGIGARIADALRGDARLPADVEVIDGGTDLLRVAPLMRGRSEVLLIDATPGATPGATRLVRGDGDDLARESPHAHWLSAAGALALLRETDATIRDTRFVWLLVEVQSAAPGDSLSPALEPQMGELATLALAALSPAR
ncbi:MAG TPA: hydrogenase maturation protease [Gemmatimonadaceae bacterium]|nr:hydrogenase maturation protease [Gemmatimonadaceae bacterium]